MEVPRRQDGRTRQVLEGEHISFASMPHELCLKLFGLMLHCIDGNNLGNVILESMIH